MRLPVWLLGAAILGCGGDSPAPEGSSLPGDSYPPVAGEGSDSLPPRPLQLEQLAVSDTAGILGLMKDAMNYGSAMASRGERSDTVPGHSDAGLPVTYSLWHAGGIPWRLNVARQVQGTAIPEETVVWFLDGQIQVVQQPVDILLFNDDRIVFWTDEGLYPLAHSEEDRMSRERSVVDSVTAWLELFGVSYRQ